MRIEPAELAFDKDGTPFSPAYGDVYHSADSGPGQSRHVFLGGNDLPGRWAHAPLFTILETGFGLGLNFLATWQAWLADPARPGRLHYFSIEKSPFGRDALAALHERYAEFAPLARQLRDAWPPLVPGLHRLHFEDGRVTLTLAFADVVDLAPLLQFQADAIYLDGFAPQRNTEMWSPQLMKRLARLARPGTSVATYSASGAVREALESAGFSIEKRPGFGRKRDMLRGTFAPRWSSRRAARTAPACTDRRAIVVGASLAGAAVCERLAARGWRIDLVERRPPPSTQAPPLYAGVFHPHISRDDCILSRVARCGYLYASPRWLALERAGHRLAWSRCGVLQLPGTADEERRMEGAVSLAGYPAGYAQYLPRDEAEARSGCRLNAGGWWFPGGGWIRPASLVAAQLAAADGRAGARIAAHFGTAVQAIARLGGEWQAIGPDGSVIAAAPVLVLANSNDMTRLAPVAQPLATVRGQVSYLPAGAVAAPGVVLSGKGYVLPAFEGIVVTGSTYDFGIDDPEPRIEGHAANLARLSRMLPEAAALPDPGTLDGAVGFRCVAPDHLPLVGALPDVAAARERQAGLSGAQLPELPRCPGLYCASGYGSRGLVWSALAGELIASLIEGEPAPLEADLAEALDPGRFTLRQARRGIL